MTHDVTLSDLDLTLPVPDGWQVGTVDLDELSGGDAGPPGGSATGKGVRDGAMSGSVVVLAPGGWGPERGFRPNLTVTAVEVSPPRTPHRAGTEALAMVLTDHDTHLAAYDLWPGGRRLTWLSWARGEQLVVVQWVLARATRVVTITGTVDAERWTTTSPLLHAMVEEARWEDQPAPELPYEPRWRRARLARGPAEPRRDTDLVELGENVEDLSRVAGEQRFRPSGVTLDRDELVAFLDAEDEPPVTAELADVGLAAGGRPTEAGERVRTIVRDADRVVRVDASVGLLPLSLSLYRRRGDTVVLCTDGVAQWEGTEPHGRALGQIPTRLHLMDMSTVGALGTLVSWLGVSPAWSLAVEDAVTQDALTARLNTPSTKPPAGAGAQLRQVWDRLGALWTLRAQDRPTRSTVGMAAVSAADRGTYQLQDVPGDDAAGGAAGGGAAGGGAAGDGVPGDGDLLVLRSLPSAALLDELVRLVIDPAETWLPLVEGDAR